MVSQLAKEDLDDLRADGLNPTDEDVIRLHAIACRITDGRETTAACAPRFAFAGGVTFWEPTVAAWQFYEFAKSFTGFFVDADWLFAFAVANGRRVGYLSELTDEKSVRSELKAWMRTVSATKSEVARAVYHVTVGYDDVDAEKTELAKANEKTKTDEERERDAYAKIEETLREAAATTGLTIDDIMAQPISRLQGMIYEANVRAGMEMTKSAAKAHAEYLATLKAVRERLTKERGEKSDV